MSWDLIKGENLSFHYLDKKEDLNRLISLLDTPSIKAIGIDTETRPDVDKWGQAANALNPHTSLVRLIQLKIDIYKYPIVIDVLKIGKDNLIELINKLYELHLIVDLIAHNATYEYMLIKSNWGICFTRIRDSMTAMASLGVSLGWKSMRDRGLRLSSLARDLFDVFLDKSMQVSDWSRYDLLLNQLEYAALDVGAPDGTTNKINNEPSESIIIDGYILIRDICINTLKEPKAFELDQYIIPYLAESEYNGIVLSKPVLKAMTNSVSKLEREALLSICKELNITVENQLIFDEELNNFRVEPVIPHLVLSIVNSNTKLLARVNKLMKDKLGKTLDNIQGSTLTKVIASLKDNDEDEEDEKEFLPEDIKTGTTLLDSIINYKLNWKVGADISKYMSLIDPIGRIHRPIRCIGTSTGRMSSKDSEGTGDKANLQGISTKKIIFELPRRELFQLDELDNTLVRIEGSIRNAFITPKGMSWISVDYASQELRILAAILAGQYGDDSVLRVYEEERDTPYLINPETGESYENPNTDLHLQAAIALNPELKKVPLWLLKKAAGDLRRRGKMLNFSIVYGKGASGFAADFNVSIGEAEEILARYYKQFPGIQAWVEQVSSFAQIEGTLRDLYDRLIYVAESNAKGLSGGNTVSRKSINAVIQGTASDMMKLAVRNIMNDSLINFTDNENFWAQPIVHDELNCLVKGNWYVKEKGVDEEGLLKYDLEFDEEVINKSSLIVKHMEDAESEILSPVIGKPFPCKATSSVSFYWKH